MKNNPNQIMLAVDTKGNIIYTNLSEFQNRDDLFGLSKGKVVAKRLDGKYVQVSQEEFDSNPNLVGCKKGFVTAVDSNGVTHSLAYDSDEWLSGEYHGTFFGKKHSDETKKKIGENNSIAQKGKRNSQFGTKWINRNGENKKVTTELLNEYLENGWVLGRKDKTNVSFNEGMSQEVIDKIIYLKLEGVKVRDIVENLGVSKTSVVKYWKIYRESI